MNKKSFALTIILAVVTALSLCITAILLLQNSKMQQNIEAFERQERRSQEFELKGSEIFENGEQVLVDYLINPPEMEIIEKSLWLKSDEAKNLVEGYEISFAEEADAVRIRLAITPAPAFTARQAYDFFAAEPRELTVMLTEEDGYFWGLGTAVFDNLTSEINAMPLLVGETWENAVKIMTDLGFAACEV